MALVVEITLNNRKTSWTSLGSNLWSLTVPSSSHISAMNLNGVAMTAVGVNPTTTLQYWCNTTTKVLTVYNTVNPFDAGVFATEKIYLSDVPRQIKISSTVVAESHAIITGASEISQSVDPESREVPLLSDISLDCANDTAFFNTFLKYNLDTSQLFIRRIASLSATPDLTSEIIMFSGRLSSFNWKTDRVTLLCLGSNSKFDQNISGMTYWDYTKGASNVQYAFGTGLPFRCTHTGILETQLNELQRQVKGSVRNFQLQQNNNVTGFEYVVDSYFAFTKGQTTFETQLQSANRLAVGDKIDGIEIATLFVKDKNPTPCTFAFLQILAGKTAMLACSYPIFANADVGDYILLETGTTNDKSCGVRSCMITAITSSVYATVVYTTYLAAGASLDPDNYTYTAQSNEIILIHSGQGVKKGKLLSPALSTKTVSTIPVDMAFPRCGKNCMFYIPPDLARKFQCNFSNFSTTTGWMDIAYTVANYPSVFFVGKVGWMDAGDFLYYPSNYWFTISEVDTLNNKIKVTLHPVDSSSTQRFPRTATPPTSGILTFTSFNTVTSHLGERKTLQLGPWHFMSQMFYLNNTLMIDLFTGNTSDDDANARGKDPFVSISSSANVSFSCLVPYYGGIHSFVIYNYEGTCLNMKVGDVIKVSGQVTPVVELGSVTRYYFYRVIEVISSHFCAVMNDDFSDGTNKFGSTPTSAMYLNVIHPDSTTIVTVDADVISPAAETYNTKKIEGLFKYYFNQLGFSFDSTGLIESETVSVALPFEPEGNIPTYRDLFNKLQKAGFCFSSFYPASGSVETFKLISLFGKRGATTIKIFSYEELMSTPEITKTNKKILGAIRVIYGLPEATDEAYTETINVGLPADEQEFVVRTLQAATNCAKKEAAIEGYSSEVYSFTTELNTSKIPALMEVIEIKTQFYFKTLCAYCVGTSFDLIGNTMTIQCTSLGDAVYKFRGIGQSSATYLSTTDEEKLNAGFVVSNTGTLDDTTGLMLIS